MKDLTIALNIDETLQDGYIFRGKCAYLLGDNNLAFLDFQRLILSDPVISFIFIMFRKTLQCMSMQEIFL